MYTVLLLHTSGPARLRSGADDNDTRADASDWRRTSRRRGFPVMALPLPIYSRYHSQVSQLVFLLIDGLNKC